VWHAKTEAPSHPIESVLELGLQTLPDHRPEAPGRQPLELRHNAAVSAQQPSVRRPMQTLGAGNETIPAPTGSATTRKTIGIVRVSLCTATVAGVPTVITISGWEATNSLAERAFGIAEPGGVAAWAR